MSKHRMKMNMSFEEFLQQAERIAEHWRIQGGY